jgi:NADH dehydrogenase [ubiquinone] 1 alpha subcomplex assembly factor 7
VSDRLRARLVERIRTSGPLRFDEYVEAALYDPDDGFFAGPSPVRAERHFVTSPHLSTVFAGLLTVQLRDAWTDLDKPAEFTVVDLGAGDGTLARQIQQAAASDPAFSETMRVVAVERGSEARRILGTHGFEAHASIDEVGPFTGVLIAHELFDNVPFRLFKGGSEIWIDAVDDALVAIERPSDLRVDGPVSSASEGLVQAIARALHRGYAFVIDYGFTAGEQPGNVRGFAHHHMVEDLLADPGATDITAPVDLDALARAAVSAGLHVWGPVPQRDALMSLGYRATLERMRADQQTQEQAGEWRTALEYFGERGQAAMLVDPTGLGDLKFLAFGTSGLPAPRALR